MGWDVADVDQQNADDQARERALGLSYYPKTQPHPATTGYRSTMTHLPHIAARGCSTRRCSSIPASCKPSSLACRVLLRAWRHRTHCRTPIPCEPELPPRVAIASWMVSPSLTCSALAHRTELQANPSFLFSVTRRLVRCSTTRLADRDVAAVVLNIDSPMA